MEISDLINVIVEQNDNYRQMLQWSIGSIITLLVIFLTANFFTMRKFRQEEVEKIKQEILINLKEGELKSLKGELHSELKRLNKREVSSLTTSMNSIERDIKNIKKTLKMNEGKINFLEASIHYDNKIYKNAFNYYLLALNCYLDSESKGYVGHTLSKLEKTAEKVTYLLGSDLSEFNKVASRLESQYETQVKRIKNILDKIDFL